MTKKYPLEQLVFIKTKKVEEAEKALKIKKEILLNEQEKLKKVEQQRDTAKKHKEDKLKQIREALDQGERTDKIEQMRLYFKITQENLIVEEKKVSVQKKEVDKAEVELETARKVLLQRQKDVEKLYQHKKEWTREELRELEKKEAAESDEMGSARFILNKRKKKGE